MKKLAWETSRSEQGSWVLRPCILLHAGTDVLCFGRNVSRLRDTKVPKPKIAAQILAKRLEFNVFKYTNK